MIDSPLLTILTGTRARRLTFEGDRCTGVEVDEWDGVVRQLTATSEVIVCAGTVDSPRLLMLSGIGPAEELAALGIEVISDLSGVGKNLSDHLQVPLTYEINQLPPPNPPGIPAQGSQLFWKSRPDLFAPDLQPLVFSVPIYSEGLEGPDEAFTIGPGIIRPASRGSIRLTANDPDAELLIDPDYFSAQADVDAMFAAIALCREIAAASPLAEEWGARELHPGLEVTGEGLREYINSHAWSYWHPVGTCKMGIDVEAVVDPELRVRGVVGLRVADASIMPTVPSGNTAAPCVMIGEKAGELIAASIRTRSN